MKVSQQLGIRIRSLRTPRNGKPVTQQFVARRADISVSYLSMIEQGQRAPGLETLGKIADALEVPLPELFSFDSDPEKLDALYRPLIDFCRTQTLTKREVDRLLAMSKAAFE